MDLRHERMKLRARGEVGEGSRARNKAHHQSSLYSTFSSALLCASTKKHEAAHVPSCALERAQIARYVCSPHGMLLLLVVVIVAAQAKIVFFLKMRKQNKKKTGLH